MRIIFCADYWNPLAPDSVYEAEASVVERLHLNYSLMHFEALVEKGNAARAVHKVEPAATGELAIYRGWMLKPHAYERLYTGSRYRREPAANGFMVMGTKVDCIPWFFSSENITTLPKMLIDVVKNSWDLARR